MSSIVDERPGQGADERTPYEILIGEIDRVLEEWRRLVRVGALAELPSSRLIDSMPEILPGLIRLARDGATQLEEELKLRIASDHGGARREDDVPVETLTAEWYALKRAVRQVLARHGFVNGAASDAIERLEHVIDEAIGYTLRGYYQPELDTLKGRGLERRSSADDRRRNPTDRRTRSSDE
jgi:hypothetical protein